MRDIRTNIIQAALCLLLSSHSMAQVAPAAAPLSAQDAVIVDMQQAFRQNDVKRLSALLPQARGHLLEPWAAYWQLRARLDQASSDEIQAFLARYAGSYQEDRLRADWLLQLGRQRNFDVFRSAYAGHRMRDEQDIQCYALVSGSTAPRESLAKDVLNLWYSQRDADEGCTYAVNQLHAEKKIDGLEIWRKARVVTDAGRFRAAVAAVDIEAPQVSSQLALIQSDPVKYLEKRYLALTQKRKELVLLALIRVANQNPSQAASMLEGRWGVMLNAEERNWAWAAIGKQAALRLQPEATEHFDKVKRLADLNDDLLAWQVRAALRVGQWPRVMAAVQAMSPSAQKDPAWVYWLAQAQLSLAKGAADKDKALQALVPIASIRGFYEQLALQALGQPLAMPSVPAPLTAEEKAQAQNNAGLQRALRAIALGLRPDGVREWNYEANLHTPGGMNDRQLLAAADMACARQVWDRCINSSDRTKSVIDLAQRFPMPFRDSVVRHSQKIGLDPAFVYGLVRQESRFITDARSHVGASGLMQVMPATARWTARKIGLEGFRADDINDRETNLAIGTAYLKLVLDEFGGSMPLATAAYNAGPGRPRAWRNGPALDGAIWAETIPFSETRDYVKKVMANTSAYALLLHGKAPQLSERLGRIEPRAASDKPVDVDLP
jgi:soluble lytic murein transglycosylase